MIDVVVPGRVMVMVMWRTLDFQIVEPSQLQERDGLVIQNGLGISSTTDRIHKDIVSQVFTALLIVKRASMHTTRH